jgi:hypothetical protein
LPVEPFGLKPWPRKYRIGKLPERIAAETECWLDVSCAEHWDDVAQFFAESRSDDDRAKKDAASHSIISTSANSFGGYLGQWAFLWHQ